jgi:hypothetical protein
MPPNSHWREALPEEELLPGDLGEGVDDIDAVSMRTPRAVRRVPVTFSSVVLLLTLTIGVGMAAGLLAGPSPWNPAGHGSAGSATPPGTIPPIHLNNTSNPPPTRSPEPKGNLTGPGNNSTVNRTGPGVNDTNPNGSRGPNSTASPNGTSPNSTSTHPKGKNASVVIYRNNLPWLPSDSRYLLIVGAGVCLVGLAIAVTFESLRPPPVRGNPWMGPAPVRRRVRPRPAVDPHQDLNDAVSALRLQLDRYARSSSGTDAEVREGIIRMYSALLSAVTPGLGNLTVRTPREVEWLAVRYLDVRPATAHELTWLFEEARYSTHRMPPTGIARAQQALTLLLHDLERWAVHA